MIDVNKQLEALKGRKKGLILTHNNPDPDAIASAEALRLLLSSEAGVPCVVGYGGIIGRPENRALCNLLQIPLTPIRHMKINTYDLVALVDTQPGTGNNELPAGHPADIVIDHHPRRDWEPPSPWTEVHEDIGATSSICFQYLQARKVPIDRRLATMLVYGIQTDTMDLGRGAGPEEFRAYFELLPDADPEILSRIRFPNLSFKYFKAVTEAIANARIFGKDLVEVTMRTLPYPELPAEMADFFIRAQGIHVSFCAGVFQNDLYLSLRTEGDTVKAGELIQQVAQPLGHVGGHEHAAGGLVEQVPEDSLGRMMDTLTRRLCDSLGVESESRKFLDLA